MSSRLRTAAPTLVATALTLALAGGLVRAAPAASPAAVAWPPSTGLLLSEVMTGGSIASDEFVELYDGGVAAVDLAGDEVVYVTATGSTVTRKAAWTTPQLLEPGQHLLLANTAGVFASRADITYSGGLAAPGGVLAVRTADGTVIDALGWGTAANAFVEGTVAPAPAAGSSLERLPGGLGGNATDTNDDSADWFAQAVPDPQALADPAVLPIRGATPQPTPTVVMPTDAMPSAPPTAAPTATAAPSSPPEVTPTPPTPTAPATAGPTPTAATASPTSERTTIAAARAAPRATALVIQGVLTTPLGFTDGGHGAFIQDATAGIALYLTGPGWPALASGTEIRASGTTDLRYGQTTVRLAAPAELAVIGPGLAPAAAAIATGAAGEAVEGLLVTTAGTVTGSPETLADGFSVTVDDGDGPLRLVVASAAGIGPAMLARDAHVAVTGVLGQHASSSADTDGYRLYLRAPADVQVVSAPSPTPSAGGPGDTASPSSGTIDPIASLTHLGQHARIHGTVTSAGAVWGSDGRRLTLQDATGAILVRLPPGVVAPPVGSRVDISGTLSHYLAAPELAADAPPVATGDGTALAPRAITHAPLAAGFRWELGAAAGTVVQVRHGASWRAVLRLSDGSQLTVGAPAAARAPGAAIVVGARVSVTGIVRPPAIGATDPQLYLMPRGPSDVIVLRRAASLAGGTGGAVVRPAATPPAEALDADLADLPKLLGRLVRVGGVIVASHATRLVIDDGTAQAVVRLPADALAAATLPAGTAITLVGRVVGGVGGTVEIALASMADLTLAGDPGDGPTAGEAAPANTAVVATPPGHTATAASPTTAPPTLPAAALAAALAAAAVGLVAAVVLGVGMATRRRRPDGLDRASRRPMADRLGALRRPSPGTPSGGPPESAGSPRSRAD